MRVAILSLAMLVSGLAVEDPFSYEELQKWSLNRAVQILNDSPWARTETFTRIVGGVGSGVSGEKEIFNTFYIRFLSARSIRAAYLRLQQIQHQYGRMTAEEKTQFDEITRSSLEMDVKNWIVVTVAFRSNDPNEESRVRQFFESEAADTLRNRAFLSSDAVSQVPLAAYFPPAEETVGAKFVFPREVNGIAVVGIDSRNLTFELIELPGADPQSSEGGGNNSNRGQQQDDEKGVLRSTFDVQSMVVEGELIL